jgi:hypothetical protein
MATATQPTLTCVAPKTRGFAGLCCLKCNAEDAVTVLVCDTSVFHCTDCGDEFSTDDVREHLERWQRVLAWVEMAPEME